MKISAKYGHGFLLLILASATTLAFVFLGLASFIGGIGVDWALKALPVWLVIEALLLGSYFGGRPKPTETDRTPSYAARFRRSWWISLYIVLCVAATSITATFFPPQKATIYASAYWSLLGVSLVALFWLAVFSKPDTAQNCNMRRVTTALLLLAGFASGPFIALLLNAPSNASAVIAIVGLVWIAPILLWEWRLYPFKDRMKVKHS